MSYKFNPFTGTFDDVGTPGTGGSSSVPTYIEPGTVYTVAADTQVLFRKRIKLGSGARIKLKGILVGV